MLETINVYLNSIGMTIPKVLLLGFLVGFAGFLDSVAGGGGLVSLPSYLLVGFPAKFAAGTNKLSACCGASMSFTRYYRAGFIDLKIAIPCVITGMMGSVVGATFVNLIDENIFKIIIVLALPFLLIFVLSKKSFDDSKAMEILDKPSFIKCVIISFVIGMYDGFYGPGTGMFLILLFTTVGHMNLNNANGVAKSVNFATNVGAIITHIFNHNAYIAIGIFCGIFSIAGSFLGTKLFKSKGAKIVRPIMSIVLTLFIIKVLYELLIKR